VTTHDGTPGPPAATPGPTLAQLRRDAESLRHPLTRALLVLTFTTGMIDATTFLGLGQVFAGNMTGNIILLGFGLAHAGGLPVLAPLASLGCFLAGAAAGGALDARWAGRGDRALPIAMGFEIATMVAAAVILGVGHVRPGHVGGGVVIGLLALGLGLRNAVVRAIGVPDVTTTVLTTTLTRLAAGTPWTGGDGSGSARRIAAVITLLLGALAGALLLKAHLWLVPATAAAVTLLTLVVYRSPLRWVAADSERSSGR
jgi:uncharacterized membrane protein YoaK (UPF0700 family)